MTFEQFQTIVRDFWPNADKSGYFQTYDGLETGRIYYTWQHQHFGAIAYDSNDTPKCWYVDNGRGSGAYGNTLEEADKAERAHYEHFINTLA